jgi:hypothetical protein
MTLTVFVKLYILYKYDPLPLILNIESDLANKIWPWIQNLTFWPWMQNLTLNTKFDPEYKISHWIQNLTLNTEFEHHLALLQIWSLSLLIKSIVVTMVKWTKAYWQTKFKSSQSYIPKPKNSLQKISIKPIRFEFPNIYKPFIPLL